MLDFQKVGLVICIEALFLVSANFAAANPTVSLRSNLKAWSGEKNFHGCEFFDDSLTLIVSDGDKQILSKDICSSYGKATVKVAADAKGNNFVFLEYSEGRGTNATTDYLVVYHLGSSLEERARELVSQANGPTSRWAYEYDIERPASGGLIVTLTLHKKTHVETKQIRISANK